MMMGFIRIGSVIFYLFILGHAASLLSCLSISLPCAAFSSCGKRGWSSLQCISFSLQWLLSVQSTGPTAHGLQQLRLAGSRAQAQQLWCTGLVALSQVEYSWTRNRTLSVPALAGEFLTSGSPGKSLDHLILYALYINIYNLL